MTSTTYLSGLDLPVAVVDSAATSWAGPRSTSTAPAAARSKHINGYFVSSFESARLTVASCAANACPRYLGSYVLKLTD